MGSQKLRAPKNKERWGTLIFLNTGMAVLRIIKKLGGIMPRANERTTPEAPEHLSERARELWAQLAGGKVKGPGPLALFQAALEAMDRADGAREAIAQEGLTVTTKTTGAVHVHPLVKVESDARRQFAQLWKDLGLDTYSWSL